jgi:hypothetical protein
MAIFNYNLNIRSLTCQDAANGLYLVKYVVMDKPTVGASTKFWHEGMANATALSVLPADNVIPAMPIEGKTADILIEAVKSKAQTLALRLTAGSVPAITVAAGYVIPVDIEI